MLPGPQQLRPPLSPPSARSLWPEKGHVFKPSILKVEFKDSHRKLSQSNNQSPGLANSRREEPGPPLVCLPQPYCPGKQCSLPRLAVLVAQAQDEPTGSEINTSSNSHPPTQQTQGLALRYNFLTSSMISAVLPAPAVDPMPTSFALACSASATLFFILSASFCFLKSTHGSQITSGLTPQVQPSPHVQSGHMHFGLGHFFDVVFFVEEDGSLMIIFFEDRFVRRMMFFRREYLKDDVVEFISQSLSTSL